MPHTIPATTTLSEALAAENIAMKAELEKVRAELAGARETIRLHGVWDMPKDIQDLTVRLEAAVAAKEEAEKWRALAQGNAMGLSVDLITALALNARLVEGLEGIANWCEAYSVEAFPEEAAESALRSMTVAGIDPGALHASWARHLLNGIGRDARALLAETNGGEG